LTLSAQDLMAWPTGQGSPESSAQGGEDNGNIFPQQQGDGVMTEVRMRQDDDLIDLMAWQALFFLVLRFERELPLRNPDFGAVTVDVQHRVHSKIH
jgi:hypothetical protein